MEPKVIWILATIFLAFIYPFVLLGNILGFVGADESNQAMNFHQIIFQIFLWVSLSYPVTYLSAFFLARRARVKGQTTKMILVSILPLVHIFFISILFFLSFATETASRTVPT